MGLGLFHPEDRRWLGWLRQLWPKQHKDVLLHLRKWLKEALRAEKITPGRSKLTTNVTPAELRSLAGYLMGQPGEGGCKGCEAAGWLLGMAAVGRQQHVQRGGEVCDTQAGIWGLL